MTNKELRAKYGDKINTEYYQYPDHFFSPNDYFTMHIPTWSSYFTRFQNQPDLLFLEIGTGHGRSSVWLLENVLTQPSSRIITVDIQDDCAFNKADLSDSYDSDFTVSVSQNLEPYVKQGKCEFHVSDSKEFFRKLYGGTLQTGYDLQHPNSPLGRFDFVYLDGSHDPDHVMYESAISFELLKPGGFLLFDDYGWGECRFGIEAFLLCYKGKYNLLVKDWQVLIEKL